MRDHETNTERDAGRYEADLHADDPLDDKYPGYDRFDDSLGFDGRRRIVHNPDPDPEWVAAYHAAMQEARRRRAEMDGVA